MIFIFLIIVCGFLFGLIISKKYNQLFQKKRLEKISNNEEDKDFVELKFMSVKEANEINNVLDDNFLKFNKLKNFDILNEAKKNRELIDNLNKKNSSKKNYEKYISINIFLYFYFLFIFI